MRFPFTGETTGRPPWARWSLSNKLFFSYATTLLLLILGFALVYFWVVLHRVEEMGREMTSRSVMTLSDAVVSEGRKEHQTVLRAYAESAAEVARQFHGAVASGEYSEAEARRRTLEYLTHRPIGSTGYYYVINSDAEVIHHPWSELIGTSQEEFSFIRNQTRRRSGFFTYQWANPGEPEPRRKIAYMSYFLPWDWIITATDYEEGLLSRINSEGVVRILDSYEASTGGATYVVNGEGEILFNSLSGSRWSDEVSRIVAPDREGTRQLNHDIGQSLTYIGWKPLSEYDAAAAVVYSGDYLTRAFGVFMPFLAISLAITLVLLLLLSRLLANMVTSPIRRVTTRLLSRTGESPEEGPTVKDDLSRLIFRLLRTSVRLEYEERANARAQQRLAHLASHDSLTGLPNRTYLSESLQQTLNGCRRRGVMAAVLFMDIDHFKDINDSYGHPAGDALLKHVAATLQGALRGEDFVSRFGGDEFVMVLNQIENEHQVTEVVRRLLLSIRQPVEIAGQAIRPAVTIGAALFPENGEEPGVLLQNADAAMYEAKRAGRGTYRFHDPKMNRSARSRLALQDSVRFGLQSGEFELFWQPIVEGQGMKVRRAEALLRWHREGTLVAPGEFLPLLEGSAAEMEVGRWVAQSTARTVREHFDALPPGFSVSINVAAAEITENNFVNRLVEELLPDKRLRGMVRIEITESAAIRDIEAAKGALAGLRNHGIGVHLDDFGEGYASLRYLREFGFDAVKLDRSFLREVPESERASTLVRGFIELAHGLGLEVTIEGVETEAQLQFLRSNGADFLQGYHIGRPMEVGRFLSEHGVEAGTLPSEPNEEQSS